MGGKGAPSEGAESAQLIFFLQPKLQKNKVYCLSLTGLLQTIVNATEKQLAVSAAQGRLWGSSLGCVCVCEFKISPATVIIRYFSSLLFFYSLLFYKAN